MSHPIYSRQQLLNRGMVKVKKVAADLGVLLNGDKRLIQNWVDAIIEHQAAQAKKVEIVEATIVFDDGLATCELAKYHVIVGGEIVHSVIAYAAAEGWVTRKGYTLIDSQTLAQNELEVEMEQQATTVSISPNCDDPMGGAAYKKDYSPEEWHKVLVKNGFELEAKKHLQDLDRKRKSQSVQVLEQLEDEGFVKIIVQSGENIYTVTPAHPVNNQRCECGDNHFRGTECKHQIAVKNEMASRISFISPSDFGFYEAILDGDVNHVIATIDHESTYVWRVEMNRIENPFISYQKAEEFIKDEFVKGIFMGRGSGRISQVIEDMGFSIEDSNFVHDFGQSYTLRVYGTLAGSIFLNGDLGWTINGVHYQDDWRPVAKDLVKLTRHEYLLAV